MRDLAHRMIATLRTVRLARWQMGIVALVSAAATGLIIAGALGRTEAQKAVLAALRTQPTLVRFTGGHAQASSQPSDTPPSTAAPSAPAPVTPTVASPPSQAPAGNAGNTGAVSGTVTSTTNSQTTPAPPAAHAHRIHHVFLISLTTTSFGDVFGDSAVAKYLSRTLQPKGTLLGGYETLGRSALPDALALVSGQAPNADTAAGCPAYAEFPSDAKPAADGQVPGNGCVYPNTIVTLADQVASAGKTWKAYIEDMGTSTCIHPNSDAVDNAVLPFATSQYATRHNPFIYFHSLLDLGGCASNDVSLDKLATDLRTASATPTLAYVAPRACDEAGTAACPDGTPAGVAGEDAFLKRYVPQILASPAYKHDGLLVITFGLAGAAPTTTGPVPTGALLVSPYADHGKTLSTTYNPYSVLASIETLFGYDRLAHARGAKTFLSSALPTG